MGYRIVSLSFAFCVLLVSQCCTHSNGSTEINKEMYDLLQQIAIDENNGGHKLFKFEKCDSLMCAVCSGDPAGTRLKPGSGCGYGFGMWGDSPLGSLRLEYAFNDKKAKRFIFGVGHQN